ncbi:MAG: PAS domain S-box [Bacillota bacterium]|nr:MAG: PAS domain S-box [Bacillota bacterium]MBS3950019.1 PAS domain-containing protein [Peptococcaceae bacterium]
MNAQQELTQKSLLWLASSIKGVLVVIDTAEKVVFANTAAYALYNVDPSESMIGWHIERVFSYTGFTRAQSALLRSLHEGIALSDVKVATEKGTYLLETSPLHSGDTIVGAVALGYDISDEEKAREELHEIAGRLTNANAQALQHREALDWFIECSPLAIVAVDKYHNISYINKAMLNLATAKAQDVLGKPYANLLQMLDLAHDNSTLLHVLQGHNIHNLRHTIKRRIFDVSGYSIIHPMTGESVGTIVMATDVTDKIHMESELARLDRLNLVGEMAASIAHEIRNPMTTVRGFLQILASKPELQTYRKFTDLMIEEIDRANGIITTYLSLSRTTVTMRPCDIGTIIKRFAPVLNADALMRGMQIRYDVETTSPVNVNEAEIKQLLANLVKNALESMAPGRIVTIKLCEYNSAIRLEVADQGCGIAAELLPKLGTPFLTTKDNGTGLGLAVCYRIAERHGARLSVETSPAGSVFIIDFLN